MFMAHILLWSREETGLKYLAVECGFDGLTWRLSMKVGDLVTIGNTKQIGLVTEVGKYKGNGDVKVLWAKQTEVYVQQSSYLKVLTTA
jgi:hypothetical protein